MGVLDCFTFAKNGSWLQLEEQRNIFEISFLKPNMLRVSTKPEFTFSTVTNLKLPVSEMQISSPVTASKKSSARKSQLRHVS